MSPAVSEVEFAWREWVLGEGRFADNGPRDAAARAQTGAPEKIPEAWWGRLEEFLARRDDSKEPPEKPSPARRVIVAARVPIRRAADDGSTLSPHFRLAEFDCHDHTKVPRSAVPALRRLCADVIEPLRDRFGPTKIMSGYRHTAYNKRIGGAKVSQHIYDLHPNSVAADLTFARGRPSEWADAAEPLLPTGGLGRYPGFIHVDNRSNRARW